MEWLTLKDIGTVAGAAAVVSIVVAVLKSLIPTVQGRTTQIVALAISLICAAIVGQWDSAPAIFLSIVNGFVVFLAAVGLDNLVTYKKRED